MQKKINQFLKSFLLWFAVFYLALFGYQYFFGKKEAPKTEPASTGVLITPVQKSLTIGNLVSFKVENTLDQKISFVSPCGTTDLEKTSLHIFRLVNGEKVLISKFQDCGKKSVPEFSLEPEDNTVFSLNGFNEELFSEAGTYQGDITVTTADGKTQKIELPAIEIQTSGMFRELFRAVVTKPLFNLLVFFTRQLPGHPFGWSIVFLTIIVRLILFVPNQKAMRSQRHMQEVQPKIAELREQYKDNQQMLAAKTMELYKTHKINPMSSCLPMLIQLPIMLGLYYIVRDGMSPHLTYLLYSFHHGVNIVDVNSIFFGLDLQHTEKIFLPVIVGIAQWFAIWLSLASTKKRNKKLDELNKAEKKDVDQMQQMNKFMLWGMPIMIAFFTAQFPAAVGIYWLTSTLFGIAQQKYVNWQLDQPRVVKKIA